MDLAFSQLSRILNSTDQSLPNTYFILLGGDGRYFIHPDTMRLFLPFESEELFMFVFLPLGCIYYTKFFAKEKNFFDSFAVFAPSADRDRPLSHVLDKDMHA